MRLSRPIGVVCLFAWASWAVPVLAADPPASRTDCFSVQIKAYQKLPEGERVLAEPHLMVTEGRAASFIVGGEQEVPEGMPQPERFRFGTELDLSVFRHQGKLFLYLRGDVTEPGGTDPEHVTMTTAGLRLLHLVKLGQTIRAQGPGDVRWEVTVQDAAVFQQSLPRKAAAPQVSATTINMGGVTPRIIIQEEGEEKLGLSQP